MLVVFSLLLGGVIGWLRAAKMGGNTKDKAQYAAAHALFFAIAGLFLTIALLRQ